MKSAPSLVFGAVAAAAVLLFNGGCATATRPVTFATVEPVLQHYCVHCHGPNKLKWMPSFTTTEDLAKLRGDAKFIVPGNPDHSRFYQVTILADDQPGAMPPSGHAIPKREAEKIRRWIAAGAPLPDGSPVTIQPHGTVPRSR